MKRFLSLTLLLLLVPVALPAQSERSSVRKGNRAFAREKYQEAEIDYKKGVLADSLSNAARYNLGNTYYRMENYAEADKAFAAVADSLGKDPRHAASLYHNMGNSLLRQQNWEGAIEAYKNALRRNPSDMETKSNLAYAQLMREKQQDQQQNQQNQQDQQQNQQNQQNQQDPKQDQQKDQNQDQQNDQQDPNQDRKDEQKQQAPPPQISQQDARQMLQAIQDKEKETQDKVKKEKALLMKSKQKEKNW